MYTSYLIKTLSYTNLPNTKCTSDLLFWTHKVVSKLFLNISRNYPLKSPSLEVKYYVILKTSHK